MRGGKGPLVDCVASPIYACAPMVRQSDLPFRMLVRHLGATLTYTPMISAGALIRRFSELNDAELVCSEFFPTHPEDRPLVVQFHANEVNQLVDARRIVNGFCDAVDLNLGCPQSSARVRNFGAFLMDSPELVYSIVSACKEVEGPPVFCKIRIYDNLKQTLEWAKQLQNAGCQLLAVHGRMRDITKHNGPADWDTIAAIRETLSIPVIANGNIHSRQDILDCFTVTEAAGVMCATGLLRKPDLFLHSDINLSTLIPQDCPAMFPKDLGSLPRSLQYAWVYLYYNSIYPSVRASDCRVIRDHFSNFLRKDIGHLYVDIWGLLKNMKVNTVAQFAAILHCFASRWGYAGSWEFTLKDIKEQSFPQDYLN